MYMPRTLECFGYLSEGGEVTSPPSLRGTIRSPPAGGAPGLTGRHRLGRHSDFVIGNDLADDGEDPGSRVDAGERVSHSRRAQTEGGSVEHGADSVPQRFLRRLVGCEIDTDAGPRHACVDVGLVLGHPRGDQRNSEAHGLVDTAIAAIAGEPRV